MPAQAGEAAPGFETKAYVDGGFTDIKLTDYLGKWVLLIFYPGDFTFVCPTELAAVAARYQELQALGVEVLSISTDSHYVHKAWQDQELSKMVPGGIPYAMLADPGGRIGIPYGVHDAEAGVDIRGRFLIDPDGIIQALEVLTPSVGRNVDEMVRQVKAFQHARATGEATPCDWQPENTTLKPGADLVGKVFQAWKPGQSS